MNVSSKASAALSRAARSSSFGRSTRSILLRTASLGFRASPSAVRIALRVLGQARFVGLLAGVDSSMSASASAAAPQADATIARSRRRFGGNRPGVSTNTSLSLALGENAAHGRPGRLSLAGDDRDFLADQRVDEGRLAGVGRADDGDEAASGRAQLPLQRSRKACAAACSAARLELAAPTSGSKPSIVTRMMKWGACAGPFRSTSS